MKKEALPEWTIGEFNETEEPIPQARNKAEDKDFLLTAMQEAKNQLEIASAWSMEFPENVALQQALGQASLLLQEAFKNVPNLT